MKRDEAGACRAAGGAKGMGKGEVAAHVCPMAGLLETLTRPWTMHVLWALSHNGPMRFGALKRSIEGVSSRVLTERLRVLEEKGFLYREYKPSIPPEVTYGLTKRTTEIQEVFEELGRLAQKWKMEDDPKMPLARRARDKDDEPRRGEQVQKKAS
jgi:DNA-binding HxlR family transcriptional regulator